MRVTGPILTVFAAACIAAAGCSGGNAPGLPPTSGNAASNAVSAGNPTFNGALAPSRDVNHSAHLVAPLIFNGRDFSIAKIGSCKNLGLGAGKGYLAPRSGRFMLKGNVTLPATCVPKSIPRTSKLFLAATWAGATHRSAAGAFDVVDSTGKRAGFVPIGGPANWKGSVWTFRPVGFGFSVRAHAKYTFFIVSTQGTTTSTGNFVLLQPLSFDGANFSVVPNACFQGDPEDAPPYTAPTSAPLVVPTPGVVITPTCVPSPLPSISPLPQLFIVAVDVSDNADSAHVNYHARSHTLKMSPQDDFFGVPATEIAGPVNVTDNPWTFAPDSPGLTMVAGTSYAFFIAAALPPPPPPAITYREVVPLGFDGTNFTVPAISNCNSLPAAVPYTAPTSTPLTLTGNVTITPTCPPTPYSSSSSGSSATGQLFIVAVAPCNATGGGGEDVVGRLRPNDGGDNNCQGGGIYGDNAHRVQPHDGGCSSSSSSSSCGGCQNSSSGDMRSHDGSGSGGGNCTITGFAIAGPVNVTDNPWSFAPIVPPLNLVGGTPYSFYIGMTIGGGDGGCTSSSSGSCSGGGDGGDGSR
jgi:hypothetical protein